MKPRFFDFLRNHIIFLSLLGLIAATTFGCYDSTLTDPYESTFTQLVLTNLSTVTPVAVAAVSGQAAHITLTNRFTAPTLKSPTAALALDAVSGRTKASFTPANLSSLDNGAFYELWVVDGSTSPAQNPISLGKFNLDPVDGTIITYSNPSGLNPVDSGSATFLFSQVGVPAGASHNFPIDLLNSNGGNNVMVLTIENPGDNDFAPSGRILLKANITNLAVTMTFPHSFAASTGYATVSTSPAGTPKGTLTLHLQNWPDISTSGFTYQIFVVAGGIYTAGNRFKCSGGAYETVISDFTTDLTAQDRVEITIEPLTDFSAANFPLIPANGAIVQNATPNSMVTLIPAYMSRLQNGAHYELWTNKGTVNVSLGKFNIRSDGAGFEAPAGGNIGSLFNAGEDLTLKDSLFLTVEQPADVDAIPSQSVLLSGLTSGTTNITMLLTANMSAAAGTISVGTEPGGAANGYLTLQLRGLPDLTSKGFRYEAWVEKSTARTSAGKFDSAGQDKLTVVKFNSSTSIMSADAIAVTIEPIVDPDQAAPFPCTILRGALH